MPQIAEQLLAKVLTDLDNTKSESVSTAGQEGSAAGMTVEDSRAAHLARRYDEEAIEPPVQVKGEVPEGLSDSEVGAGRGGVTWVAGVVGVTGVHQVLPSVTEFFLSPVLAISPPSMLPPPPGVPGR